MLNSQRERKYFNNNNNNNIYRYNNNNENIDLCEIRKIDKRNNIDRINKM